MNLPPVVSREEWLAARTKLLAKEKEVTRLRDAVNAERRRLPMVRVEKDYVFHGADGKASLLDLFAGRRQLYVHHFMWRDELDRGCPSCTAAADTTFTPATLGQLAEHDLSFAAISRAPIEKIVAYSAGRGWSFPFYSSHGTDFNHDFQASVDPAAGFADYNYRTLPADAYAGDYPAASVFVRDGDEVFHAYSAYARGLDHLALSYAFLDLTPYGRQEDWEDSPAGWPQHPTYG